jgi:lipopolysaccharide/colanic/teichoic acid biosynthesis glycosyltransferase
MATIQAHNQFPVRIIPNLAKFDFKQWVALDIQYIQENNFMKDVEILTKIIPTVIIGHGAY